MKQITLIVLLFFANNFFSQDNLFQKIKEQLKKENPKINIENKLIVLNVWSVNDPQSRETNIQLNKTITVYQSAKLKGGRAGIIGVLICKDEDKSMAAITLNKDKVLLPIVIKETGEINNIEFNNALYDSAGNLIHKDVAPENIYGSIHQLITR